MSSFTIKKAEKSDLESLYHLVKELAVYEQNDPQKVMLENLAQFGFGEHPIFHAYLCEFEDQTIGYSLHYYQFSAFCTSAVLFVEDLYVKPHFRNQGAAMALIENLKKLATEMDCVQMQWHAFKWNELANGFYAKIATHKDLNNDFYEWTLEL